MCICANMTARRSGDDNKEVKGYLAGKLVSVIWYQKFDIGDADFTLQGNLVSPSR